MSTTAVTISEVDNQITVISTAQIGPPGPQGETGPAGAAGSSGFPGTDLTFSVVNGVASLNVITHWWIDTDNSVHYEDDPNNVPSGKEAWLDPETLNVVPGLPGLPGDAWLLGQTAAQAFVAVSGCTYNDSGALLTATVRLSDGTTGVYLADSVNPVFPDVIDAYHIVYSVNGGTKTVTQTTITRDDTGQIVTAPALTVT